MAIRWAGKWFLARVSHGSRAHGRRADRRSFRLQIIERSLEVFIGEQGHMVCVVHFVRLVFCVAALGAAALPSMAADPVKRKITIQDSIEFASFDQLGYDPDRRAPLLSSPDGTRVLFSTTHGDVLADQTVTRIYVVEGLPAKPSVTKLAEFASSTSEPAVDALQWASDSLIAFRAQGPTGRPQIYTLDVPSRQLQALSDDPAGVAGVRISKDGGTFAYLPYPDPLLIVGNLFPPKHGVVTPSDSAASSRAVPRCESERRRYSDRKLGHHTKWANSPRRSAFPHHRRRSALWCILHFTQWPLCRDPIEARSRASAR